MADPAKSVSLLAAEIEAKSHPRLRKCEPSESRRAECEERAAACYRAATAAMGREWSVRRAAHDIERSVRMHLDYQSGSRSIPVDVVARTYSERKAICAGSGKSDGLHDETPWPSSKSRGAA